MLSYYLNCRRKTESKSPEVKMGESCYFLGVQCVAVKNPNSSKSKEPPDC